MNSRNILYIIIAIGAAAVIAVFLFKNRDAYERTPYHDILIMRKLPYNSGIILRGGADVRGQSDFDKGMVYYDKNQFDKAIPSLQTASKQQPDSATWKLYLGICLYMSKKAEQAVEILEQANTSADSGTKPHTRWYLALARLMNGQRDRAEEILNKLAKEKGLYDNEARDLLIRLRKSAESTDPNKTSVYAPTSGDRFAKGKAISVQWGGGLEDPSIRYRIMLSQDGGITFLITMTQGITAEQKSWNWPTAETHGDHLKVRVDIVTPDSTILGIPSDEFSLIVPPLLMMVSPAPGLTLRAGLSYDIQWKAIGAAPNSYSISLTQSNGHEVEQIRTVVFGAEPSESSAEWTVYADPGDHYRLRLDAEFSDTTISVFSEREFSIKPEVTLEIRTPQITASSATERIAWSLTGPTPLRYSVELCDSTGYSLQVLAQNLAATDTQFVYSKSTVVGSILKLVAIYEEGQLVTYSREPVAGDGRRSMQTERDNSTKTVATQITLEQNFPNPFNNSTTIRFTISEAGQAKLSVYNINGQLVKTLVNKPMSAGSHEIEFNATGQASGSYIYRVEANGTTKERQMILLK